MSDRRTRRRASSVSSRATRCRPTRPRPTARSRGTRRRSCVVEAHGGDRVGLGYTYATARPRRARSTARSPTVVRGRDALDVAASVVGDGRALSQPRPPGHRRRWRSRRSTPRCGISRRGCSSCRWSTLLGAVHDAVPVYGSGGFTCYSVERLARAARRLGRGRDPAREDEGRPRARTRPRAASRRARGDRRRTRSCSSTPTAPTRASRRSRWPSASPSDGASAGSRSRSPPTTSRACGCCATARRPGSRSRPASTATTPAVLPADARGRRGRLPAGRRHALRRRSPASCASPRSAQAHQLELSAHCAPQLHAHACCAVGRCATSSTSTTTSASSRCSSTACSSPSDGGCGPTARGPGTGSSSSATRALREWSSHDRDASLIAQRSRRRPRAAAALPAPPRRARRRSASRSTSSTTRARSATSGCGRRSCSPRR